MTDKFFYFNKNIVLSFIIVSIYLQTSQNFSCSSFNYDYYNLCKKSKRLDYRKNVPALCVFVGD